MASGCTHQETSFVSLDGLDNISILSDEDNDLEEENTHLFNAVSNFVFKFEKNPLKEPTSQILNVLKLCNAIRGHFERFQ